MGVKHDNVSAARPAEESLTPVLPPDRAESSDRRHVPALDGLRGLAIVMVTVSHFLPYRHPAGDAHPAIRYGLLAAHVGQTGVDLFFVLSGFLITGILLDTRHHPRYFKNFYGRRTLRIFPLYYGVLIVVVLLPTIWLAPSSVALLGDLKEQWWLWTYLTNIALFIGVTGPVMNLCNHFWSLAVEEHFYLVWPAVVYALSPRRLAVFCIAMIIAAIACRYALASRGLDTFFLTPCRMDVLGLGGLLAIAAGHVGDLGRASRYAKWGLVFAAAGLVPLYLSKTGEADRLVQTAKYTMMAGFYSLLVVAAVGAAPGTWTARLFCGRTLRWFGKYSYGMYVYQGLLHALLLLLFPISTSADALPFLMSAVVTLTIAVTVDGAIAWLSWHLYENHFMELKRYFSYSR